MLLSVKKFAEKAGVTPNTVRNWEESGKITCERTKGGHRRINLNELYKIKVAHEKFTLIYSRVSTSNKKDDLERQKKALELYAASKGYKYKSIEDIGSGLNYNKKGLLKLIELIENEEIDRLIITHKDRLLRFGSEIIFKICQMHDIDVEIINNDEEKTDFTKELVNDVLSIITVFSAKLYGSRSNKNKTIIESNKVLFK